MENLVLSTQANTQPQTAGQTQKSRQQGKDIFARALSEASVAICDTSLDTTASLRAASGKELNQTVAERTSNFRKPLCSESETEVSSTETETKFRSRDDDWKCETKKEADESVDKLSLEAGSASVQCQVQPQDTKAQKVQSQEGEAESVNVGATQAAGSGGQAVNQSGQPSSLTGASANAAYTVAASATAAQETTASDTAALATAASASTTPEAAGAEVQVSAEAVKALAGQTESVQAVQPTVSGESADLTAGETMPNEAGAVATKANTSASVATANVNTGALQNAGNAVSPAPVETTATPAAASTVSAAATAAQATTSTANQAGEAADGKWTAAQVSGESPPAVTLAQAAGTREVGSAGNLSEPARSTEARSTDLAQQISQGVETMTRSGQTTMRINLHPEELGRIDLRLTVNAQGTWVSVSAEQKETNQLLQQSLYELRQSLTQAGVQLGGLNVGQEGRQGYQETQAQAELYKTSGRSFSQAPSEATEPAQRQRNRSIASGATLEYLV